MITILAVLGSTVLVARAQTVPSLDLSVSYTCPDRTTISEAYWDYCPPTSNGGQGTLDGISTFVSYDNAPDNFQTAAGGFELGCRYTETPLEGEPISYACNYAAGGGILFEQNPGCASQLSTVVPQPSPGVDYRRRSVIKKRATVGLVPTLLCPFGSDDGTVFVNNVDSASGQLAVLNAGSAGDGYAVEEDQAFLGCGISTDVTCYYSEDPDTGALFLGSFPAEDSALCPQSLCEAVNAPNEAPPTRRGVYLEGNQGRIRRNQVDPRALRAGASWKRR